MTNTSKPGIAFWIIGVVALIWNLMGVANYLMQAFKTQSVMDKFNAEQLAFLENSPTWMTALFAIAVFAGAIGCIALLMRKEIAASIFIVSFLAAIVHELYWMFGTNAPEVFSVSMAYLMPTLVIVVAAFLIWYSKKYNC
ncbi:MAG: hypothetical protein IIC74_02495 [Bacteroidetes bacterium]|nr:hypothetical protein [Bacteroidota bacterium]